MVAGLFIEYVHQHRTVIHQHPFARSQTFCVDWIYPAISQFLIDFFRYCPYVAVTCACAYYEVVCNDRHLANIKHDDIFCLAVLRYINRLTSQFV